MKTGDIQYRFKGSKELNKKEQNFVQPYKGYWQLLTSLFKILKKKPDAIFLFKK